MEEQVQAEIQKLKTQALAYYQQKKFQESLQLWQKIMGMDSKNSLAMIYIRRIQHMALKEVPPVKEPENKVRVMVVDDSPMMLKAISRMLGKHAGIEVVDAVSSGEEALQHIPTVNPDVVSLDVNMPGMDGITTLKHIMVQYPRPVIMLSAFTEEGSSATFDCLFYGAIDFIAKPTKGSSSSEGIQKQQEEIWQKILNAARVKVNTPKKVRVIKKSSSNAEEMKVRENARWVVAMGGGEGGYNAYLKIIPHLPGKLPFAILAVQYTKEEYLQSFCDYLNRTSRILVKKAQQGELIKEGVCYFTHNGNYLKIEQSPEGPCCQITPTPIVISQQNVINQLFFSVSEKYGANSMGVLLTGSGVDGIEGLQELKRVRAMTMVQDPKTCLIPQTVTAALEAKCVDHTVMDVDIAAILWHLLKHKQNIP